MRRRMRASIRAPTCTKGGSLSNMGVATHVCVQSDELVLEVLVVVVLAGAGVDAELESVDVDVDEVLVDVELLLDEPPERLSVL